MIYLTINPDETVKTRKYLYGNSKTYNFITIENPTLLGYPVGGHMFDETGTYIYSPTTGIVEKVTMTDGNEVTEWFRQTYPNYYLREDSVVYESTVVYPDTSLTGYHITSSRGNTFIGEYNTQYDYFNFEHEVYVVTEEDAVYAGDYVCEEATVVITGADDYSNALFDEEHNRWYLMKTQESKTNEIPVISEEYFYEQEEWEKVGDGLYKAVDSEYNIGVFKDGEYKFYFYDGSISYNYPCSYMEETQTPVTVITSAGTPTAITGTEVIVNMNGNTVHGLIYETGTWYGQDHFYTGSTFDNMVFAAKGSFYAYGFNITTVEGCQGGKVFEGIVPGVAYSETSTNVYYNGGFLLKRLNDGKALYAFRSKTVVFSGDYEAWFKKHFYLNGLNDFIVSVSPNDVESVIMDGTEYKPTLDADPENWTINLVFEIGLYNRDTGDSIYPRDGKITVTFTDEFIAKGILYVLYSSHAS